MLESRVIVVSLACVIVVAAMADLQPKREGTRESQATTPGRVTQSAQAKEIWMGDILFGDTLSYNGYVIEKRLRKVRSDHADSLLSRPSWIDVSYAVIKRNGKVVVKVDGDVYFGMGNDTRFGLLSFLHGPTRQLAVSQDRFRGGRQWVISLAPKLRIIFDGPYWAVGREGDDMRIIDLNKDGAFEIIVPITDFYDFQDKLPIARIPLPEIIFKYDGSAMKYVPANPLFESYALRGISERQVESPTDEIEQRAMILQRLLTFIYAGKQDQAWELYDSSYKLSDKEEIRRRVKAILSRQPVHKFIYNARGRK